MSLVGSERMLRPVCKQMDLFGLAYLVTSLYLSLSLSVSLSCQSHLSDAWRCQVQVADLGDWLL